jgi:hypothetical protein
MIRIRVTLVLLILFFFTLIIIKAVGETPYPQEETGVQREEKADSAGKSPCLPPKITYLVTDYGKPGDTIHIKGRRFGLKGGKVTFNDIPAEILTWRMETIYVKVPDKATTGPVIVNNGCDDSNSKIFTVGPPPPEEKRRGTTW